MKLATEIIKEQREKIEEQIKFYEDMCKTLLADVDRMSNKPKNLREYLDKNYSDQKNERPLSRFFCYN